MLDLVEFLHEELPLYLAGAPFTSGLRVTAGGIETTQLLKPMTHSDGSSLLSGKAVLVLSSTPDPVLRQWAARLDLQMEDEYRPRVPMPDNVRFIQDTSGFYGKRSTKLHGIGILKRARSYVQELAPKRMAVVTHNHLRADVASALEIPLERVLYFGNMRGSNAVRDADVLMVIGTPGMSTVDAYWMACAVYRGGQKPPSKRMAMQPRQYGGWRDSKGRGREVEVQTFTDGRVAEVYESSRRDELIQAIFRCRPFDADEDRFRPRALTVVLLTEMPVEGLRVDDLRFGVSGARAEEALARRDDALIAA